MFKYYFSLIIVLFTQLIAILMWAEYVWLFKRANGGVGGNVLEQIHPAFWILIIFECIFFFTLVSYEKNKNKN